MIARRTVTTILLSVATSVAFGQGYTSQLEFSEDGRLQEVTFDGTKIGYRFEYTPDGGISTSVSGATNVSAEPAGEGYTNTLIGNYPNPFFPTTSIVFEVASHSTVRIDVFDLLGRRLARAVDGPHEPGRHTVSVSPGKLAPGTYFYRLEVGDYTETRAMVVVR